MEPLTNENPQMHPDAQLIYDILLAYCKCFELTNLVFTDATFPEVGQKQNRSTYRFSSLHGTNTIRRIEMPFDVLIEAKYAIRAIYEIANLGTIHVKQSTPYWMRQLLNNFSVDCNETDDPFAVLIMETNGA